MPIILIALLGMGAANALLRPITARLHLQERLGELAQGNLQLARLGDHCVAAHPRQVAMWRVAVTPAEFAEFDEARALYARMLEVNTPYVLEHTHA